MRRTRNILIITVIACAYLFTFLEGLFFVSAFKGSGNPSIFDSPLTHFLILLLHAAILVFVVINSIYAVKIYHGKLRASVKVLPLDSQLFSFKLILLPFFCLQIAILVLITFLGLRIDTLELLLPLPPALADSVLATILSWLLFAIKLPVLYLMTLNTSIYLIADILAACRQLNLSRPLSILLALLQLIPITNVLSLPFITNYLNKKHESSLPH
ncbi:MAG: hypothetical protein FWF91_03585 [Coriobacteriia bacterium]|nr:hypothetical protein [Coriobacteriia bacterium]